MFTNVALLLRRLLRLSQHRNAREEGDVEKEGDFEKKDTVSSNGSAGKDEGLGQNTFTGITLTPTPTIVVSSNETAGGDKGLDRSTISGTTITPTSTICLDNNGSDYFTYMATSSITELPQQPTDHHPSHRYHHDLLSRSGHFLEQLLKPYMVAIILSFVISLVDPLKALFIPPSSNFQPHFRPTAPDGKPPLAFIFDTATFISEVCVPLGLVYLGSSLACLSLRSGGPFPKGAIASLALGKMVVTPIIGVAITRWFTHVGFVHRDNKVL